MPVAAIDIGSNTLRMLIAETRGSRLHQPVYFRHATRLAGGLDPQLGLAKESIERTLLALEDFATRLNRAGVSRVRAVGTAALRDASNSADFLAQVKARTGLAIDVIDGRTEGQLSCLGMLSVLDPAPSQALLFDIGGGSTELILHDSAVAARASLPLGAVRLFEDYPQCAARQACISKALRAAFDPPDWRDWFQRYPDFELIGTAGTVTTLAALKLKMRTYQGKRVNNLILENSWLRGLLSQLSDLEPPQRLALPGMEAGREDIILPGLEIVIALLGITQKGKIRVSEAGILEGLLLEEAGNPV